jgi:predicted metal-dependent hydrolase
VVLAHGKALIYTKEGTGAEQRGRFIREWYRARLMEKAVPCLRRWELATGLHSSELRTKYMKTRWGTCNTSAGRIWLNVELAKKPEECLRYVTLHELAHLKISGHGRDFKALLDRYMPDWREIRKRMNGSGN